VIAVWIALGLVAGFGLGFVLVPVLARRQPVAKATVRPADGAEPPPRHLDELIEAARAAALRIRVRPDGFDVLGQPPQFRDHVIGIHVVDTARVTLSSLRITDTGEYDLIFHATLALVPMFGAITLTAGDGEIYRVDGTRNQHELRNERAGRVTAKLRDVMSRMR
jgi:hypothetical protein